MAVMIIREDEQFQVYKNVISKMNGKKVIIRTLDIGADKQADYFDIPKEENPAMGFRAIRICLHKICSRPAASRYLPCERLRYGFHHVPDDYFGERGEESEGYR